MTYKNKYALVGIMGILVGVSLFVGGCQAFGKYEYQGGLIDPPIQLPDFELAAADEQPFHLSDVEGDIALIYFGYTYCPDVCPLTNLTMLN